MKKIVVLLLAVLLLGSLALAQEAEEAVYIPNVLDIYLPENPSTGFVWRWEAEEEGVIAVTEKFFSDDATGTLTGAGGTHWLQFAGEAPGTTAITLTYSRPWEEETLQRLVYRLTVNERLDVLLWGFEMT